MNKKKGLLIGSIVLAVVAVIGLVIVLIAINGDGSKSGGGLTESSLTDTELITETEDETEADGEADSEESIEDTTEEETTVEIEVVLPEGTPEEIVTMDVIPLGYGAYIDAYLYLLDIYEQVYGSGFTCSLIDYDVSLELELLIDINKELTLYKYEYGNLYKIIDKLDYGQFSSGGYEYAIIAHSIRRVDTEYDGLIKNETYSYIDLDVTEDNNDTLNLREHVYHLKQTFFDDVNENGVPDEGEATGEEYVRYYVEGQRVYDIKYYNAAISQGEYIPFKGELSLYETRKELHKPELEWISDKKCKDAYKDIIKQFEKENSGVKCTYALIDCNGDETPELVCDMGGAVSLYVYEYGKVFQLLDKDSYGEDGDLGYEYLSGKNVFRKVNSNHGDGETTTIYAKINDDGCLEKCGDAQNGYNFYMIRGYYSREEIEECLTDKEPGRR